MSASLEVVEQRVFQYLCVSFMVSGHTKFAPDLFGKIAKAFYAADVFNVIELEQLVQQFAVVILDSGGIVRTWRERRSERNTPTYQEFGTYMTL